MVMFAEAALIQLEAGNQTLKAIFNSKLVGKGKYLTEHLQPHSTGMFKHTESLRKPQYNTNM